MRRPRRETQVHGVAFLHQGQAVALELEQTLARRECHDAAVAQIPGVSLLDLDDLRTWAAKGIELRKTEADKVRVIVAEEVERYVLEATARQAAPLVAQLHERAEAVRAAEVARQARRLAALTPAQREAVEAVTRGVVAKLLHGPSVRLKDDVGSPRGERNAAAVRDLFDLQ